MSISRTFLVFPGKLLAEKALGTKPTEAAFQDNVKRDTATFKIGRGRWESEAEDRDA